MINIAKIFEYFLCIEFYFHLQTYLKNLPITLIANS